VIVIEYKGQLARFGYKYLEQYYRSCGVEIDIMELDEEKSAQEELVEDMIAIVTSFSARIYGKRGGRVAKKLTELIEQEVEVYENHG
jgi:putative resolvase